jgi:hypothetical protein
MGSDTRATIILLGALALLGWAWAGWLMVRPAPASDLARSSAERWLVAYAAPSGVPLPVDRRLVPALAALASVTEGAQLVNGLAASGTVVLIGLASLAEGLGFYDTATNDIALHPALVDADPRALAALLAHEAQHAWDDFTGVTASRACAAGEIGPAVPNLEMWRRLVGAQGKHPAAHLYEEELNADLAMYREGSGWYWITISAQHLDECEARALGTPE